MRERDVAYGLQQFRILCQRAFLPPPFICWRGRLRSWVWIRFGFGREVWTSCGALTRAEKKKQSGTTSVVRRMFEGRGLRAKKSSATLLRSGPSWQLLQPWSWSRHPPNADSWAGGEQGLQQLSPLNTGRCVRAVAICILPRGLFSSAPFFNVCLFGRLLHCGLPVRPI